MEEEYSKYIGLLEEIERTLDENLAAQKKDAEKIISKLMRNTNKQIKGMQKEIVESWGGVKKEWKRSKKNLEGFAEFLEQERKRVIEDAQKREMLANNIINLVQMLGSKANESRYPDITPEELIDYITSYPKMNITDEVRSIAGGYISKIEKTIQSLDSDEAKEYSENSKKILKEMKEALENEDGKRLLYAFHLYSQYFKSDETKKMYLHVYNALEIRLDDVAKYFTNEYVKQLEDQTAAIKDKKKKRMLADMAKEIEMAVEKDDAKKVVGLLNSLQTSHGSAAQQPSKGGLEHQDVEQIDSAVLEYAALLRAKEKIIKSPYVKSILEREQDIANNYAKYLKKKLAVGKDESQTPVILKAEMELLNRAAYQNTARDKFNRWWKKHSMLRMIIGFGMVGAGMGLMFVNPAVAVGWIVGLGVLRGAWNGLGAWMATEGVYDTVNYMWRRKREDGAQRVVRSILTGKNVMDQDIADAVHYENAAEMIASEGLDVARNIRKHRGIKRVLSVALGIVVGLASSVWFILRGMTPSESAGHVNVGVEAGGTPDKAVVPSDVTPTDYSYNYVAEPGGSLWKGAKEGIEQYCTNNGITLSHDEKIYAIDWLKDRMAENPQAFDVDGWVAGHEHQYWIYEGEKIHIDGDLIKKAVDKASGWYAEGGKLLTPEYPGYDGEIAANTFDSTRLIKDTGSIMWIKDTVKQMYVPVPISALKRM